MINLFKKIWRDIIEILNVNNGVDRNFLDAGFNFARDYLRAIGVIAVGIVSSHMSALIRRNAANTFSLPHIIAILSDLFSFMIILFGFLLIIFLFIRYFLIFINRYDDHIGNSKLFPGIVTVIFIFMFLIVPLEFVFSKFR